MIKAPILDDNDVDLSIIVINWNTLDLLRACLASAFDNLGSIKAQVLVVDNASTDGSADMVEREFPAVRLLRNTKNRGFAAANNQGFDLARGRHILLLNSDTIVHGDVLSASVSYLDNHLDVGAMGCQVLNPDGSIQITCGRFPSIPMLLLLTLGLSNSTQPAFLARYQMTDWGRDVERSVDFISGCFLMTRRSVLDQVGPLDEDFFFFGEETDWCKRIREAGWDLRFVPVGQITHYGSASAKKLNFKRDVLLTDALVHLHKKHNGIFHALTAWTILLGFNLSRAALWSIAAMLDRQPDKQKKAQHFRSVVLNFPSAFGRAPVEM